MLGILQITVRISKTTVSNMLICFKRIHSRGVKMIRVLCSYRHFQQMFSYLVITKLIGGKDMGRYSELVD